ncbi:MAG: precorrin-6A synthase (deacetylating) [Arachnia sp.]
MEASKAIAGLDVLFVVVKSDDLDDLVEARRVIIAQHRQQPLRTVELRDPPRPWRSAADYPAAVALWREQRREQWGQALAAELAPGQTGGFLVWGDPSLYESTLAIVREITSGLGAQAPQVRVIPGISCVLALAARHQIPLNRQGASVQITPARLVADGLPADVQDAVVMLDGKQTFALIDPSGIEIYWAAFLGTPDEILISGPLEQVREQILRARAEAAARKGWMFDTYLLRRVGTG